MTQMHYLDSSNGPVLYPRNIANERAGLFFLYIDLESFHQPTKFITTVVTMKFCKYKYYCSRYPFVSMSSRTRSILYRGTLFRFLLSCLHKPQIAPEVYGPFFSSTENTHLFPFILLIDYWLQLYVRGENKLLFIDLEMRILQLIKYHVGVIKLIN